MLVVSAPNIIYDAPVIQGFCPENVFQCLSCNNARYFCTNIPSSDISLSIGCFLAPRVRRLVNNNFPTGQFIFLRSNPGRDRRWKEYLDSRDFISFKYRGVKVYQSSDYFTCMPKPGLIIATNEKRLMQTILSRMDAWWLPRVAMPMKLKEWQYVNQLAPYWGVRHFIEKRKDFLYDITISNPDTDAIGIAFDYFDMSHPFQFIYLSENGNWLKAPNQLIFDTDEWVDKHIRVERINNTATKLVAFDSRAVPSVFASVYEYLIPAAGEHIGYMRHAQELRRKRLIR